VVTSWLQRKGGTLLESQFVIPEKPRWEYLSTGADGCRGGPINTR
jgi:hypothetical protein